MPNSKHIPGRCDVCASARGDLVHFYRAKLRVCSVCAVRVEQTQEALGRAYVTVREVVSNLRP